MPGSSSTFAPTGEFISICLSPLGPGRLCQNTVQGAARQRYLEIVVAESTRAIENRVCRCIESARAHGGVDQFLLRLRRSPGLVRQPAERQTRRADPAARAIND